MQQWNQENVNQVESLNATRTVEEENIYVYIFQQIEELCHGNQMENQQLSME